MPNSPPDPNKVDFRALRHFKFKDPQRVWKRTRQDFKVFEELGDIKYERVLGFGGFGIVQLWRTADGKRVAIKSILKEHHDIRSRALKREIWWTRIADYGCMVEWDDNWPKKQKLRSLWGKPAYKAPEQFRPNCLIEGALGPHTNVYQIGQTMHDLLTLRPLSYQERSCAIEEREIPAAGGIGKGRHRAARPYRRVYGARNRFSAHALPTRGGHPGQNRAIQNRNSELEARPGKRRARAPGAREQVPVPRERARARRAPAEVLQGVLPG
ncbi:hypothetical protein O1611_g5941 [Lasiodiplodia mahajangana]|uniref:Uncharacterized protein n=1 Tax=Lasiodiplodia mahajangana TaxID=1108764 RepID=A0ACC2JKE2_9PEZI|nr:hypothetical protein O1611_g5941 [Lasiodiplodia mahajangana]